MKLCQCLLFCICFLSLRIAIGVRQKRGCVCNGTSALRVKGHRASWTSAALVML